MKQKGVKVSIIGAGYVGSTTAYALMIGGIASEIVIVDINKDKADGEVMDLSHGASFVQPVDIIAGGYSDTENSDVVIITAGAAQKEGETRLDLVNKNIKIFKTMIPEIVKYSPNSILLVVSNPVDILSYITYKISGFPKERVIGSGTVLDTSRFKHLLGEHFNIDVRNVHTYIMGEHGDSEIATWSLTNIAGVPIDDYCNFYCNKCTGDFKYRFAEDVKNAAYEIIKKKGATYYAVALAVKRIVEAIIRDENSILTVSTLLEGEYGMDDVYLGVPSIVGIDGIREIIQVPLSDEEKKELIVSGDRLKDTLRQGEF